MVIMVIMFLIIMGNAGFLLSTVFVASDLAYRALQCRADGSLRLGWCHLLLYLEVQVV